MKQPKTEPIDGEICKIEKKEGKKNPFYILDILASIDGYDGKADEVVYQCTAFGRMSEKVNSMAVGDYVTAVLYAGAREWNGKWYPNYTLASIEVHTNAVPTEEANSQTDDGQQATGEAGDPLPF